MAAQRDRSLQQLPELAKQSGGASAAASNRIQKKNSQMAMPIPANQKARNPYGSSCLTIAMTI